jgi:hypothetical protein
LSAGAGTAAPINFNGLVRQYYLRESPELGDLQVNLVDKHLRSRQSHEIALSVRADLAAIGERFGASVQVVEVPPGPPVQAPLVAEIYGPRYDEHPGIDSTDAGGHSGSVLRVSATPVGAQRGRGAPAMRRPEAARATITANERAMGKL